MTAKVVPIDRYLAAERNLAETTRRVYEATLAALVADVGADGDVASITTDEIEHHLRRRYRHALPATFNRNRATIGSLFKWLVRKRLLFENPVAGVDRRKERTTEVPRRRANGGTLWTATA